MEQFTSRRSFLAGVGTGVAAGLAGCGGLGSGSETLKMLDWGYVYDNGVLEAFEERHGVTVERQSAQGSAESLSQMRAERADYDLVPLGNYAVTPAMEEGLIQPLDLDQVPAYEDVFDFLKTDYFEQDGAVYGIPRSFGHTPLAVNTDLVDADVTALSDLWSDELAGDAGGRDDARLQTLYRNAAFDKPLNPTSTDDVDFDALRADLIDRLEGTSGLWNNGGESEQLMRSEEVGVQPVWNYVTQTLQADGMPVERIYPEEGTKAWFIQHCVRAGAENPELAHTFIEEWHTMMGYDSLMAPNNIAVPNERVFEENNVDRAAFGLDDPDQFIYEEPKPQSLISQYTETWNTAKTEADL
ncbi:ABC transporter substrate-binding protein [Halorientalis sp.]|uniref:ABC transporter substrate-binding protein n=1 Tax=Halorientalis sp. TaxID=1931229 RepID=UPI0026298669|nr:extracellular solute-binding protein [Halorientalis sp.]